MDLRDFLTASSSDSGSAAAGASASNSSSAASGNLPAWILKIALLLQILRPPVLLKCLRKVPIPQFHFPPDTSSLAMGMGGGRKSIAAFFENQPAWRWI